jgi:hypothetical protein
MSFNYKPKIVLKKFNFEKFYEDYILYSKDKEFNSYFHTSIEEDRKCQLCSILIPHGKQIYGIPIGIRSLNSELEVDIYGNYCSFKCSFKHYRNIEEDSTKRKNIKFMDSGQYFKCIFYKIYKSFDIENISADIDFKNIKFNRIKEI